MVAALPQETWQLILEQVWLARDENQSAFDMRTDLLALCAVSRTFASCIRPLELKTIPIRMQTHAGDATCRYLQKNEHLRRYVKVLLLFGQDRSAQDYFDEEETVWTKAPLLLRGRLDRVCALTAALPNIEHLSVHLSGLDEATWAGFDVVFNRLASDMQSNLLGLTICLDDNDGKYGSMELISRLRVHTLERLLERHAATLQEVTLEDMSFGGLEMTGRALAQLSRVRVLKIVGVNIQPGVARIKDRTDLLTFDSSSYGQYLVDAFDTEPLATTSASTRRGMLKRRNAFPRRTAAPRSNAVPRLPLNVEILLHEDAGEFLRDLAGLSDRVEMLSIKFPVHREYEEADRAEWQTAPLSSLKTLQFDFVSLRYRSVDPDDEDDDILDPEDVVKDQNENCFCDGIGFVLPYFSHTGIRRLIVHMNWIYPDKLQGTEKELFNAARVVLRAVHSPTAFPSLTAIDFIIGASKHVKRKPAHDAIITSLEGFLRECETRLSRQIEFRVLMRYGWVKTKYIMSSM